MNACVFAGNVGQSAEVKRLAGKGRGGETLVVVEWSLAVRTYDAGQEGTLWVRCAAFGERFAKLAEYIAKGSAVTCAGEIRLDEYTKRDGSRGAAVRLVVRDVTLGSRRDAAQGGSVAQTPAATPDEEIPF